MRMIVGALLFGCWVFLGLPDSAAGGGTEAAEKPAVPAERPTPPVPSVLDLPALQFKHEQAARVALSAMASKNYVLAENGFRIMLQAVPHDFNAHYNLACALAQQGKAEAALDHLDQAVTLGWRDRGHLQADADLAALREHAKYLAIVKRLENPPPAPTDPWQRTPVPAEPASGVLEVGEPCLAWDPRLQTFQVLCKLLPRDAVTAPIAKDLGEVGTLLEQWGREGTAAGNAGDLYDNHDTDHSNMEYAKLPQLTRVEFAEPLKKRGMHHGLQIGLLYNAVTLGNSSTALTRGVLWRSQARAALFRPNGLRDLYLQYRANHLYFYPEHKDHDPGRDGKEGYGDVFCANNPYLIITQGSSYSDKPFLLAFAASLAALRPEVKARLIDRGLLVPTLQMIFRRSNKHVQTDADYLTGAAHPTVFDGSQLDMKRMVTLAHDLTLETLPPLAQIRVVDEDRPVVGRDYFDVAPREILGDTPCLIGRVHKSTQYQRRLVVSAEPSGDPNGRPMTYHWVVLRGDQERIKITPQNAAGSVAELVIPYHTRQPVPGNGAVESNRVDIGVFVSNGTHYSPPAFVCVFFLDSEARVYDDQHRVLRVDYTLPHYLDPILDARKDWQDEYHYDAAGMLTGWTRVRGSNRQEFLADGRLLVDRDPTAKPETPVMAQRVTYVQVAPDPNKPPVLEQKPAGPAEAVR